MVRLTELRGRFDVAFGNDPEADRQGIVTPSGDLLNPNHYLAACVAYLFGGYRGWPPEAGVGKTIVTSSMLDRVAAARDRRLVELPVGFKWLVRGPTVRDRERLQDLCRELSRRRSSRPRPRRRRVHRAPGADGLDSLAR